MTSKQATWGGDQEEAFKEKTSKISGGGQVTKKPTINWMFSMFRKLCLCIIPIKPVAVLFPI